MLSEERVKHMVKLASYESKHEDEIKIQMYEKKDYVRVQTVMSVIWMSLGYLLLVILLGVVYLKETVEEITLMNGLIVLGAVLLIYFILLVNYMVSMRRFYQKKYMTAKRNVKEFVRDLAILENMYEKEDV